MLYRIGLHHAGGGLVVRPEAVYFVHQPKREGRFNPPEITMLPLPKGAWQFGCPVYGEALAGVLATWLAGRRGRAPRPLVGCLSAETSYFGALPFSPHAPLSFDEIRIRVREVVPLRGELALDYIAEASASALQQRITYVATAQSEVSAMARYFKTQRCPLAVLDMDVFALWRASAWVMPALVKRPMVALLWVGRQSAVFAVYQANVVISRLAWSHDRDLTLESYVRSCAAQTVEQGLVMWGVCAANREGVDVVISIARDCGLSSTFLDLMPYGVTHEALADAYLAWGLALRGMVRA